MPNTNDLTAFDSLYIQAQFFTPMRSRVEDMDIDDMDRYEERELNCDMCARDEDYDNDGEIDRDRFSIERD